MPQRTQRLAHSGRVMSKIIDDNYAAFFAAHFRPAANILETCKCFADLFTRDSPRIGSNYHRQTVKQVEVAKQPGAKPCPLGPFAEDCERRKFARVIAIANLPARCFVKAKCFQLREQLLADRLNHVSDVRTVPAGDQTSIRGHQIHQPSESELDRGQVSINVCVIKLDVVYNRQFRQVMHEFWALVEIGRVVLIALDNEIVTIGDAKADAKILSHTPN